MNKEAEQDVQGQQTKQHKNQRNQKNWAIAGASVVLGLCVAWILQQWWVQDFWHGLGYTPSAEMTEIVDSLELTGKGQRILTATRPSLDDQQSFNEHCESHDEDIALLGCYTEGRIYVYDIENEQLELASNVTAAHELLHAVWERTNTAEKTRLETLLNDLMAEKQEWFDEELETYPEEERLEEVYTRAGTKLRELPAELEQNYGEIFQNRAKIVEYYETYSAPFEELQEKLEKLEAEVTKENQAIDEQKAAYDQRLNEWDAKVDQFNSCAERAGCFTSDAEFQSKRQAMLREQAEIEATKDAINQRIERNNARVDEYNKLGEDLGDLNKAMNSNMDKLE